MARLTVVGTVLGVFIKKQKRNDGTEYEQATVDLYQAGENEPVIHVKMKPDILPEIGQVLEVPVRVRTWARGNPKITLDFNAIQEA